MRQLLLILIFCTGSIASAQVKIGFVDTQRILDTLPSRKIAVEKYLAYEKELEAEFIVQRQELEALYIDYEKYHGESAVQIQSMEKKIMAKETQLQARQQSIPNELQEYSDELNAPILDKIEKVIKLIAEKQKLTMVVDHTSTLYFDRNFEITTEVIIELMKMETSR